MQKKPCISSFRICCLTYLNIIAYCHLHTFIFQRTNVCYLSFPDSNTGRCFCVAITSFFGLFYIKVVQAEIFILYMELWYYYFIELFYRHNVKITGRWHTIFKKYGGMIITNCQRFIIIFLPSILMCSSIF